MEVERVDEQLRRSSNEAYLVMMRVKFIICTLVSFFLFHIIFRLICRYPAILQDHHWRILPKRRNHKKRRRTVTLVKMMKWLILLWMKKKLMNMGLLLGMVAFFMYLDVAQIR